MLYIGNNKIQSKLNNKYIYFSLCKNDSNIDIYPYKQNINLELNRLEPIILDVVPLDTKNIFPIYNIINSEIIDIKSGVVIPKKVGTTSVEININGIVIVIDITVLEEDATPSISNENVYNVNLSDFNISNDGTNPITTSNGINNMFTWAIESGYKKVVFPHGVYLVSETIPITLRSNLIVDLGGSTLKLNPSSKSNVKVVDIPQNSINIKLVNGVIEGDKDSRLTDDETVHGIVLNGGININIDNIEITNILAYGIYWTLGYRKNLIYISKDNLEEINATTWHTKNYIDISNLLDVFQISNPFREGGLASIKGYETALIDIDFYDINKNLISTSSNLKLFRSYNKPLGAKFIKIRLNDIAGIGNGNADFGNSIAFITDYNSDNITVSNCNINNCKALGIGYVGGGSRHVIQGCTFSNNGGTYANMDLDLEDGWDFMQGIVVRDCVFNSAFNFHTCGGFNNVLYNNIFNGFVTSTNEGRSANLRVIGNELCKNVDLYCEWHSGALYFEENIFTNCHTTISNLRRKDVNRVYFKRNIFNGGTFSNKSAIEKFDNSTDIFNNCVIT